MNKYLRRFFYKRGKRESKTEWDNIFKEKKNIEKGMNKKEKGRKNEWKISEKKK